LTVYRKVSFVLSRRLLSPFGGLCVFLLIVALVAGGLGWVTRAALAVEDAERDATARADASAKERLALWQLDSRLFPTLAVENGRPYAQYFSLYIPHPVALDDKGNLNNPGRVPSPLLSAELPDWMLLHFQLDPEKGWYSPQVPPDGVADTLRKQFGDDLSIVNDTPTRRRLLVELRDKFDVKPTHLQFVNQEFADPSEGAFGVPITSESPIETLRQQALGAVPESANQARNSTAVPGSIPPPEYQQADGRFRGGRGNYESDLNERKKAADRASKEGQATGGQLPLANTLGRTGNTANVGTEKNSSVPPSARGALPPPPGPPGPAVSPPGAAGGFSPTDTTPAGGGRPAAPPAPSAMPATPNRRTVLDSEPLPKQPVPKGAPPNVQQLTEPDGPIKAAARPATAVNEKAPAVQVGPMRPQWMFAEDGSSYLLLVRSARLETKTVFQGVVLDWTRLKDVLLDEIRPLFPEAALVPVYDGEESTERQMAAIPARLDPGPVPPPETTGWTPLRLGLALGWGAALVALAGIGFGGRALIDLSERRIRFVSAVTHELRTPLTSLRLYLDLLTSGMIEDEAKQKEYLRTLHGESDRLNRLIENVLDFARLEKRTLQTHIADTKVDALLDAARATWVDRVAADGKELVVIGTVPVDQTVRTDARIVGQILGNLIDNARKYSPGAADPRIWVWAKPGDGKRIVFEVEDRGPGVPLTERATIFRPFRRGQAADTTAGGAGLGLALAKQWAEVLGGRLSYRVADGGVGACFRLDLPV
jgi:signal transduction histidine kinase